MALSRRQVLSVYASTDTGDPAHCHRGCAALCGALGLELN